MNGAAGCNNVRDPMDINGDHRRMNGASGHGVRPQGLDNGRQLSVSSSLR